MVTEQPTQKIPFQPNRVRATLISRPLAIVIVSYCAILPFAGDTVLWPVLFALVGYAVVARRETLTELWISLPLVLFLTWVIASILWSVDIGLSTFYISRTIFFTGLGILIAQGRSYRDLVEIVAKACVIVLLACWAVALAFPSIGTVADGYEAGSFKGLFVQRNNLGYFAALSLFTLIVYTFSRPRGSRIKSWTGVALAAATVFASASRTALLVSTAVVMLAGVLALLARTRLPMVISLLGVGLLAAISATAINGNSSVLLGAIGRDATLTGRTKIWTIVEEAISQQPLQGYGWGALWNAGTPITEKMWAENGYPFYHAHNGYLDVTAQVGIVGSGLAIIFVGSILLKSFYNLATRPNPLSAWPIMIITAAAVFNATEVVVFTNATWITLAAISAVRIETPSLLHTSRRVP